MIFQFEYARVIYFCNYTNALVSEETDDSIREKFIKVLESTIAFFRKNKFEYERLDEIYVELNDKIEECITHLKEKIKSIDSDEIYNDIVQFDANRYKTHIYHWSQINNHD